MCGIVSYIGPKQAYPILIKGLRRLEYRGYDSAGVAIIDEDLNIYKIKGKVDDLEKNISENKKNTNGNIGIGHTRWATHGEPSDVNAHPHSSGSGDLVIVHNGIIENYNVLKEELVKNGYKFASETDTEVLAHLIEHVQKNEKIDVADAVRLALSQVVGAYALVVLDKNNPSKIIAARKGSPLVIGLGSEKGEFFMASDATPIIEYTRDVIYLDDNEIAVVDKGKLEIKTIENVVKNPFVQKLEMDLEQIEKGNFPHFMLKEIYEQPKSVFDSIRGRINLKDVSVEMRSLQDYSEKLKNIKRLIFVGCGTSWHAGLVGKYLFEEIARLPVEVEYASEFRYRNPVVYQEDLVIAISQSGETADTLAAMQLTKERGATVFGLCNVIGSSIPRLSHAGAYTHAGPEIGVASTKSFTAQVSVLTLIALAVAQIRGTISKEKMSILLSALEDIPRLIEKALLVNDQVYKIAQEYKDVNNCLFLGRGINFPVALEGALKLKEISYIHAEGYPAAEMKHGPIALIDENMPVIVVAPKDSIYEKIISNICEIKARKGKIIAVVSEGDTKIKKLADHVIEVPSVEEILNPLVTTIPLQLLAYHIAVMRGCNVDQPRNLAKSVTVE
ncbi:glutamine--fructose-6-phosphate transaminase (isomerizing) [Candidatus Falkowbacteria bacterium HGW-Falkowbacteria-1]|uniref:Glutamine--fructose-6-phosphate aminotransferase [isomerizing] n=1 Tax=Candidatus Falkowbacteria bacterium HGW-Falkowbacteria-1 TaxID=2013768 RepID=A0A2N2E8W6_9BACT|nr:MAG: glutamine--fructose-6-phosphate transaminase (isomerizing) [Candidatus Falkowbacteria bacterium HGW-Falkowbacteria-1]